jgi:hypothetical protein
MIDARELFQKRRIQAVLSRTAKTDASDLLSWQNTPNDDKVDKNGKRAIDSLPKTLEVLKQREEEMEALLRGMIENKKNQTLIDGLTTPLLFLSGMIRQMEKRQGLLTGHYRENKVEKTKQRH